MKTGIFGVAALSLVQLAATQPHRRRHHHAPHVARDWVTNVEIVTAYAPDVIVFVDQNGKPFSTSFADAPQPTYAPALLTPSSMPASVEAPAPTAAEPAPPQAPAPEITAASAPSSAEQSSAPAPAPSPPVYNAPPPPIPSPAPATNGATDTPSGYGISYSPYKADGTCKSADEVNNDFNMMAGYNLVRIYGTDCNQVANVLPAVKAKGMKLFAGVFDINKVTDEINILISAGKNDWASFDTISVGNELINSGAATVSQVTSAIGTARKLLNAAGYTGHVVTVDTFVALIANPALCKASDYAAANCHAYFDGGVDAAGAGDFVSAQSKLVSAACGGMRTVITESGWPSEGNANGKAVPSVQSQHTAVSSLKSAFNGRKAGNMILFSAFNDLWKDPGYLGVEKSWGIYGTA